MKSSNPGDFRFPFGDLRSIPRARRMEPEYDKETGFDTLEKS